MIMRETEKDLLCAMTFFTFLIDCFRIEFMNESKNVTLNIESVAILLLSEPTLPSGHVLCKKVVLSHFELEHGLYFN